MAKKSSESTKKAAAPKKKTAVETQTKTHRETSEGAWAEAPASPVVVQAKSAVQVETVVMTRSRKKEKPPNFMSDIKI